MKKNIFMLIGFCLVFLAGTGNVLAQNQDVAYVVKSSADSFLTSELNNLNLTYGVITESEVLSTDFSQYKMILIGDDKFDNPNDIPVSQYKSLIINSHHYYKKGLLFPDDQWGWSSKKGAQSSPSSIKINDFNISITSEMPETFSAYTISDSNVQTDYLNAKKATGIRLLAQAHGSTHTSADSVLAVAYPGAEFLNGNIAQERSLFFGITNPEFWTQESRQLFKNSITWILIGEDNDEDGFFTDNDCNDNNSNINPDAAEIPYDGIDQDCTGLDLTDVDEDGFNAEIAGGFDCNDLDPDINPDNPNPFFNCMNDAPVIDNVITQVNYQESEIVEITVIASDSENDSLIYSINDSRFNVSENVLTWQTGFEDAGEYTFTLGVSDSEFTTTQSVSMIIINRNQVPRFNPIPDLEWDEDTNKILNLNDYFFDEDNDSLTFSLASTSDDTHIILESIENGTALFSVDENWNGEDWIIFRASDGKSFANSNNITLTVLPVNDLPVLENQIPDFEWDEDTNLTIDLSNYFKDIDSVLTYSFLGNSFVNVSILESIATLVPDADFNGNDSVIFSASDGEFNITSDELVLTVLPVNDLPVLDNIEDITVFAGKPIQIVPNASDADNDELTFNFTSPLDETGTWETTENDIGNYQTAVTVSDPNNGEDSQNVSILVFQKILVNEFLSSPISGGEWIELYNPYNQEIDLINCTVTVGSDSNNPIALSGTINKEGYAVFELDNKLNDTGDSISLTCFNEVVDVVAYGLWDDGNVSDNAHKSIANGNSVGRKPNGKDTDNDHEDFSHPFGILVDHTRGLSNDADVTLPVVELLKPVNNATFNDTRDIGFEFSVSDNMAETLECSLYINNDLKSTQEIDNNSNGEFSVNNLPDRNYSWNVKCSDGSNENSALENLEFIVSAPDNPVINPLEDKSVDEAQILVFDVSAADPDNDDLSFSVKDLPEGAVFNDNSDGSGIFSWRPNYDQSGNYNLEFNVKDVTGLMDSENIKIMVNNVKKPADFTDIQKCESLDESLSILIENPDAGDDFGVGEEIKIELKIENNHVDDLDIDTEVFFYDITNEKIIEDADKDLNIEKEESERIEFSIEIPEDIENERFSIFVQAIGKNSVTLCNEKNVEIKIERDKDNVIISKMRALQEEISPGNYIDLEIYIENLGTDDQTGVYATVENSELEISEKSEEFDIEEFGEDNNEKISLSIKIPENAEAGDYELTANVFFNGLRNSKTESIKVIENAKVFEQVIEDSKSEVVDLNSEIINGETSNSSPEFSTAFIILFLTFLAVIVVLVNIYMWV